MALKYPFNVDVLAALVSADTSKKLTGGL